MSEQWKAVPGYEGFYEVSDKGRVSRIVAYRHRDAKIGQAIRKILKFDLPKGYRRVTLCRDNVHDRRMVHHLVMLAFVGPVPEGMEVNHKRGFEQGDALDNLEYVTKSQNQKHSYDFLGHQHMQGSAHGRSKITESVAMAIYKMRLEGKELTEIAAAFGVCIATVSMIANKKIWRHIHA